MGRGWIWIRPKICHRMSQLFSHSQLRAVSLGHLSCENIAFSELQCCILRLRPVNCTNFMLFAARIALSVQPESVTLAGNVLEVLFSSPLNPPINLPQQSANAIQLI
jgi:hypothetical protein